MNPDACEQLSAQEAIDFNLKKNITRLQSCGNRLGCGRHAEFSANRRQMRFHGAVGNGENAGYLPCRFAGRLPVKNFQLPLREAGCLSRLFDEPLCRHLVIAGGKEQRCLDARIDGKDVVGGQRDHRAAGSIPKREGDTVCKAMIPSFAGDLPRPFGRSIEAAGLSP